MAIPWLLSLLPLAQISPTHTLALPAAISESLVVNSGGTFQTDIEKGDSSEFSQSPETAKESNSKGSALMRKTEVSTVSEGRRSSDDGTCSKLTIFTGYELMRGTYEPAGMFNGITSYKNTNGAHLHYAKIDGPAHSNWAATNWIHGNCWAIQLHGHTRYAARTIKPASALLGFHECVGGNTLDCWQKRLDTTTWPIYFLGGEGCQTEGMTNATATR